MKLSGQVLRAWRERYHPGGEGIEDVRACKCGLDAELEDLLSVGRRLADVVQKDTPKEAQDRPKRDPETAPKWSERPPWAKIAPRSLWEYLRGGLREARGGLRGRKKVVLGGGQERKKVVQEGSWSILAELKTRFHEIGPQVGGTRAWVQPMGFGPFWSQNAVNYSVLGMSASGEP